MRAFMLGFVCGVTAVVAGVYVALWRVYDDVDEAEQELDSYPLWTTVGSEQIVR